MYAPRPMKKAFLLPLMVAACATAQSESDSHLMQYQGKPVRDLFAKWSEPTRSVQVEGSGTVYLWEDAMPARNCKVSAYTDERGLILGWRFLGAEAACHTWMRMLG